jgi:prophage antirepressor-like protein
MSLLQRFDSEAYGSLTIHIDEQGREFYRAIDVCYALKHSNPSQALTRLVDEDYIFQIDDGTNRAGKVNYLSEPGLYQLIFASKSAGAKEFQRWVYSEVLPKLRASGGYIMPTATSEQLEALQAEIAALQKDKAELAGKVYYMEFGDAPDESFDSFEYTVYKNARNYYRFACAYDSLTPRQKDAITDECDKKFPHPRLALQDKKSRKKYVEGNGLCLVKPW